MTRKRTMIVSTTGSDAIWYLVSYDERNAARYLSAWPTERSAKIAMALLDYESDASIRCGSVSDLNGTHAWKPALNVALAGNVVERINLDNCESRGAEYIIMDKAAFMPASCFGRYRKIAVCEVVRGACPLMISERARGMVRIVKLWDRIHWAPTRGIYHDTMAEAEKLTDRLNSAR